MRAPAKKAAASAGLRRALAAPPAGGVGPGGPSASSQPVTPPSTGAPPGGPPGMPPGFRKGGKVKKVARHGKK